jgi:serine/threonine protein kinase/tetratricopeptide (TPR) repeat protein
VALQSGFRLGPYEILSPLDAGGQGEVYRARDSRLGREVAIKVPPERLAQDRAALARFERETRAVAKLSHPNILEIHDVGQESGIAYAVTELLRGETLRARLSAGPLPWRSSAEIGIAIAEGLAAAHACGVTHRDLKPENVFLTADGRVKILDFGLASLEPEKVAQESSPRSAITQTGTVMGTAGYMSPEQVRGKRADARSDIFSLGCILYEMVTGERTFSGETTAETLVAILREEPKDPALLAPDLPEQGDQIILRCLAKAPEARFQSARDLSFALKVAVGTPAPPVLAPPKPRQWRRELIFAAAAALAAVAIAVLFTNRGGNTFDSLAILPFANASGDPEAEYLSDGLAESLIQSLSRLENVRVLAWTTVLQYKGKDPLKSAKELGVRAVLTGRLLRRGQALVAEAELVDVRRGTRLWAEKAPGRIPDSLAADEMARGVSRSLRASLAPSAERSRSGVRPQNPEAFDLYLKGRYFWNKRDPEGIEKGIAFFQEAIGKDPHYALAFAGLADSYDLIAFYDILPPREILPKARYAAVRALELDPTIAEAQTVLADIQYEFDWSFPSAEQGFRKAIASNPGYAQAHQWYSNFLSVSKRFDESFAEIARARELDPLNIMIDTDAGLARYWAGQYDRALGELGHTAELNRNFFLTRLYLGFAQAGKGRFDLAIAEAEAARRLEPNDPSPVTLYGYACARAGRRAEALQALEDLRTMSEKRFVSALMVAPIHVGLGDRDKAFEFLEKAYEERSGRLVYLGVERAFDPLRSDRRFQDLLRRLRLPT